LPARFLFSSLQYRAIIVWSYQKFEAGGRDRPRRGLIVPWERNEREFRFARKPLMSLDSRKEKIWIFLPFVLRFLPQNFAFPSAGFENASFD